MKRAILITGLILLVSLTYAEDKKFGNELSLSETTAISTVLETPENFVGKTVQIEGTIVGVCEMRGCWIEVASSEGYNKIRVKVNDGEIVFPMETKGKTAVVEGEVYVVTPAHSCTGDCSKSGTEGEKHECEHEKEMSKVYQIKGSGAVISM